MRHSVTTRPWVAAVVALACVLGLAPVAIADPSSSSGVYSGPQGGTYVEAEGGSGAGTVVTDPDSSGGSYLTDIAGNQVRSVPFDLPAAVARAQVYVRYSLDGHGSNVPGEISITLIVPPGDGEEPIVLPTLLLSPTGGPTDWHWEVTDAGDLTPGHYEMEIAQRTPSPIALDVVGFFPTINDGAWDPPNTVVDGKLRGNGEDLEPLSFGLLATGVNGNELNGSEYIGKPGKNLTLTFPLRNRAISTAAEATVTGEIDNDQGPVMILPSQEVDLDGGSSGELTYLVPPPGYGDYTVRLTVSSDNRPPRKVHDTFQITGAPPLISSPRPHHPVPPKKRSQHSPPSE